MPLRPFASEKTETTDASPRPKSLWRRGLLVATSAALGGIAVAIWNRRTLAQMRQLPPSEDE
jgi:hypothetical protein